MSAYLKKGIAVWLLGFLTFLASLNAFNAALIWTLEGSQYEFEPYLVGQFTGNMQVTHYFWISVGAAFILFACTAVVAFRKPPLDPDLVEMLAGISNNIVANKTALEEGLETNRSYIEITKTDLLERMETQKRANEKSFETINTNLEGTRKETLDAVKKQGRELQKVSQELSTALGTSANSVREEVLGALTKQEEVIRRVERSSNRSIKTIENATADLAEMKARLETLEITLALPQPKLTSHSSARDVKGIGPRLAEELEAIGIINVGEFLNGDPVLIDDKTRLTRETAERLQGSVQLLMIPGIDQTDVELLEEVGVTNRKELAGHDPFELSRKLAEVAKTYVEEKKISESQKPTVEEAVSWVKQAKL